MLCLLINWTLAYHSIHTRMFVVLRNIIHHWQIKHRRLLLPKTENKDNLSNITAWLSISIWTSTTLKHTWSKHNDSGLPITLTHMISTTNSAKFHCLHKERDQNAKFLLTHQCDSYGSNKHSQVLLENKYWSKHNHSLCTFPSKMEGRSHRWSAATIAQRGGLTNSKGQERL